MCIMIGYLDSGGSYKEAGSAEYVRYVYRKNVK